MRILILLSLFILSCLEITTAQLPWEKVKRTDLAPFHWGVASGDPTTSSVVLWSKVDPEQDVEKVFVNWFVYETDKRKKPIAQGRIAALKDNDYTIHVEVDDLAPNRYYWYEFEHEGDFSILGRTRTAPENPTETFKFAVVSCSNYEFGHFGGYKILGEMDDIQVIIHLGDYIYEYEPNKYGDESFYRKHIPPKEILTLDDYRTRYAQYRLDPGLRKAHQMHPFITVYDDHEIANNAYQTGAENHQPESEGDFGERKEVAVKVWYEWMPVLQGEFYPYVRRTFDFGNKAKLIMLDLRLEGRQEQAEAIAQVSPDDSDQTILGQSQRDWLVDQLTNSDAQWNIIGNSVTFGSVDYSEVVGREDLSVNMDAWSGYPYDQDYITKALARDGSRKTFFITGDTHTSYAMEIPNVYGKFPYQSVAVEFGAPGLTSPSYFTSRFPGEEEMKEDVLKGIDFNKHLKYINTRDKGFLVVSLGVSEGEACWHYLEDIKNPDTPVKEVRCYRFKEGTLSSEK